MAGLKTGAVVTLSGYEWTPYMEADSGTVGFKVRRLSDGEIAYVYLAPSNAADDGASCAFIYIGGTGDRCGDEAYELLNLFKLPFEEDEDD